MYSMQDLYRRSSLAIIRAKKRMKNDDDPTFLDGAKRILDFMYNAWQEQKCCDVVIKVQGGEMHAHSVAFGAYSESLANSFYSYSSGEVINIDLSDFRRDVVTTILHFLYTTELELNCHTIGQVVSCAIKLGLDIVVHMCMDYLAKVDVDNAVLHFSIAENNSMKDLRDKLRAYILDNFSTVSQTKHFVYMPLERLLGLLKDENLYVDSEMDVFKAVVNWVDHDRDTRLQHSSELLQCVKFSLMPAEVLASEVESADWIFADQTVWKDCLYAAMKFNALAKSGSGTAIDQKKSQRKCLSDRRSPHLNKMAGDGFVVAKKNASAKCPAGSVAGENIMNEVNKISNTGCDSQATLSTSASILRSGLVGSKSSNVISSNTAAREDTNHSGNAAQYDPMANQSTGMVNMLQGSKLPIVQLARQQEVSSLTPLPTHIIAVGGVDLDSSDPRMHSKSLYSFVPIENQWNRADCELPSSLHHHGVAVMNDKLYVIGGAIFKGEKNFGVATNHVWVFDASTNNWRPVSAMREARAYLAVAVWRNRIYAIAGENSEKQKLSSIECYDDEANEWRHVTHIPGGARVGTAAAVHQDGLFVVGGFNRDLVGSKHGILSDVCFYDLLFNSWIMLKDLAVPRCHASLINVDDRLLLLGGRTRSKELGATSLARVEEYNLDKDSWVFKSNMKTARHDMACAVVGSLLYVIGGIDGRSKACLANVECYNATTNEWVEGPTPFPHPVAGAACISVTAVNGSTS